jgi:hypothetical protein
MEAVEVCAPASQEATVTLFSDSHDSCSLARQNDHFVVAMLHGSQEPVRYSGFDTIAILMRLHYQAPRGV